MSKAPPPPQRPNLEPEKPGRGSNLLTILLAVLMAVAGLVSLAVMPLIGFAPLIIVVLFSFGALQYVIWGWWLSKYLRDEEAKRPPDER